MYLVSVKKDIYDEENNGVEIAGLFELEEKAYEAKEKITKWLEEEGYSSFEVFVSLYEINHLAWYEINENL